MPPTLMLPDRRAFTLLEVVISVSIFTAVMAIAFQSLIATKRYQVLSAAHDEVFTYDSEAVLQRVNSDLATSGWFFYGQEDSNGNGVLDAGEDIDLNGVLNEVDYSVSARDRKMTYFPCVVAGTTPAINTAFPTRVDPVAGGEFNSLSPWTITRFPGVRTTAQIEADRDALVQRALQAKLLITPDLANEMVNPSNELIFLRVGVSPWNADPNEIDRGTTPDMVFFPTYGGSDGALTTPSGAPARNWRIADNYANLPKVGTRETVLHMSGYTDPGGTGVYVHRNSLLAGTDPDLNRPYGVQAWGAALNLGASGPQLRLQWETILESKMYYDPNAAQDYQQPPADLRDFIYAVIPSPRGLGRLVRAHAVTGGGGTVGVEPGNWITATTANRGYQIDLVMSDDVVRMEWTTRRHDRTLQANQVRLRMVLAKAVAEANTDDGSRQVAWRIVNMTFALLARNEYDDQKSAADSIDIPSSTTNIPFVY